MNVIYAAIDSEKNPLSVCLSLWMLLLTATDRQSVRPGWCWGIGPSSPLTQPQPFIADPSIYPTIHLSVPPAGFNCLSLHFHRTPPSTPLRAGRHRNGWFRKGGRVSQSSCCYAPCSAFTVHFCFCAAFMALICWQFRWLSHNLINHTKAVRLAPLEDVYRIRSCIVIHIQVFQHDRYKHRDSLLLADKSLEQGGSFLLSLFFFWAGNVSNMNVRLLIALLIRWCFHHERPRALFLLKHITH